MGEARPEELTGDTDLRPAESWDIMSRTRHYDLSSGLF